MSQLNIAIREQRTAFQPGEEISGAVEWKLDKAPEALELRLFWFTRGKGTEDASVVDTLHFDHPMQEGARSFRFKLPGTPYSFSGKLISLIWALELVADPSKEMVRLEIVIAPGRKEIELGTVPKSAKRKPRFDVRFGS